MEDAVIENELPSKEAADPAVGKDLFNEPNNPVWLEAFLLRMLPENGSVEILFYRNDKLAYHDQIRDEWETACGCLVIYFGGAKQHCRYIEMLRDLVGMPGHELGTIRYLEPASCQVSGLVLYVDTPQDGDQEFELTRLATWFRNSFGHPKWKVKSWFSR